MECEHVKHEAIQLTEYTCLLSNSYSTNHVAVGQLIREI